MYGLLLENVRCLIVERFGEAVWNTARENAGIKHHTFVIHNVYSETLIPRLVHACSQLTGMSRDEIMYQVGIRFVSFVGQYGYGRILKVLGRNMRDFLNGLDNLHEYLRFSYPKLSPPSFFVAEESRHGMVLYYRSKRIGYLYYVLGQIKEVGRLFYNSDVDLEVIRSEDNGDRGGSYVIRIVFDNKDFNLNESNQSDIRIKNPFRVESLSKGGNEINEPSSTRTGEEPLLTVPSHIFFDIFPFHILLDRELKIRSIGSGLNNILTNVIGRPLVDIFEICRPIMTITWENVLMHTNVVFELLSKSGLTRRDCIENGRKQKKEKIRLKGQMMNMCSWDSLIFLGTPILESLETMFNIGLYINDLSMHDSSRDLVLAGMQQSAELRLALDQEKQKSSMLEASMRRLDIEMTRTDSLLYRMIPKQVADRLRKGEPALSTCETFENVTILFSDVVGFTTICSKILPMEVVRMLNEMYTKFDYLSEVHEVYKVETIGDAYMVVSGVPEPTEKHAQNVADMALAIIDIVPTIENPSMEKQHLRTRIGIHSGMVVAGVVGIKMPRYCLFGDTVNTASRMESGGMAMSVHISESTKRALPPNQYKVKRRGTIPIKGKGLMQTYWLLGKMSKSRSSSAATIDSQGRDRTSSALALAQEEMKIADQNFNAEMESALKLTADAKEIGPQCPFAAIFAEAYANNNSPIHTDNLLEAIPSVEPFSVLEPRGDDSEQEEGRAVSSNYCKTSEKMIFHVNDYGEDKLTSVESPSSVLRNTSNWVKKEQLWVNRNEKDRNVIDSKQNFEELLKHRTEESQRSRTSEIDKYRIDPDEVGVASEVDIEHTENTNDAPVKTSLTSGVLQFLCLKATCNPADDVPRQADNTKGSTAIGSDRRTERGRQCPMRTENDSGGNFHTCNRCTTCGRRSHNGRANRACEFSESSEQAASHYLPHSEPRPSKGGQTDRNKSASKPGEKRCYII